jgi:multidrug efflux pump subunit AcrB
LILLLGGLLSYTILLPKEGFPPIQVPFGLVSGTYVGNDAEAVDEEVVLPIINAAQQVDGVTSIQTRTDDNFFTAFVQFEDSIEGDEGIQRLEDGIVQNVQLPESAAVDVQAIAPALYLNEFNIVVSVFTKDDSLSVQELQEYAKDVAKQLADSDAIADAVVQEQLIEGINPVTGEVIEQQTSFDRVGVRNNGDFSFYTAVAIGLKAADSYDVIDFSEKVQEKVTAINDADNAAVQVVVTADFAPSIQNQLSQLQSNVISGLLAVIVVTVLLISFRSSFVTALFMASVVLTTLFILYLVGISLNTISLFGLVLALGLFVDDATIIVEAIDAAKRKTKSRRKTIAEAVQKVASASFAGTMTTVLVFLPLVFVTGILGEFIRILPLTIIIALLTSFVLSLTLIPFLSRYIVFGKQVSRFNNPVTTLEKKLAHAIAAAPLLLKSHRIKGIIISSSLFLVSFIGIGLGVFYAGKVEFNIFPSSKDADAITLQLEFVQSSTIAESLRIAKEVEQLVQQQAGEYISQVSYGAFRAPNVRQATMFIELTPFNERTNPSPDIIAMLEPAIGGIEDVRTTISQIDAGPPAEQYPFKMQIFSDDIATSTLFARDVQKFLNEQEIVRSNNTTAQVTDTKLDFVNQIARKDGKRFIEVAASFDASDTTALVNAAQEAVEQEFGDALSDYGLSQDALAFDFGQESQNQESFSSLMIVGPLAVLAMFILLAFQFRSLLQPLLIFMAIPFSLFGVTYGLYSTGNPLSFFTMVGFFGLIGIAVNNTILLTDYANQSRRRGFSAIESVSHASEERFRPLVTTSLTTIAALVPLALSDPFWEPLALTIIFGLLSSTFLVIISFPYYYLLSEYLRARVSKRQMAKIAIVYVVGLSAVIWSGASVVVYTIAYFLAVIAFRKAWRSSNKLL